VRKHRPRTPRDQRRQRQQPHAAAAPTYAAIDLGTNNCRMLVARPADGGFRVIDGFSRIIRLGEGLAATGQLGEAAMARTIDALKVCADKITNHNTWAVRYIATEACRQAKNGAAFIERARSETGLALETISAETEADLTLAGCAPLLRDGHRRALLFDIGGGSTEVIWIDCSTGGPPRTLAMLSLPMGVVTLADTYGSGAMTASVHGEIIARVDEALIPFCAEHGIRDAIDAGQVQMIGTSGTVTTMGAIYLDLPRYDRTRVDGLTIRFKSIHAICAKLSEMDCEARRQIPCIGRDRADLMLMGCSLLSAICSRWPVGTLKAADRGIRDGLILGMMSAERLAETAPADQAVAGATG
jgi:exopolyphosphatase/guanosine-5'-triphosphate,3'-diphosphate pyrophosphatase